MILFIYTDKDSVKEFQGNSNINVVVASAVADENIKELFEKNHYETVIMQKGIPAIYEYCEKNGIDVYCRNQEDYFDKYYRLKKQYEDLENKLNESNNYIQSLSVHATKLDNELKEYKRIYDGDNAQTEIKRLEKQRDEYLSLYRNLLDKLDELTIENLNFKKKGK